MNTPNPLMPQGSLQQAKGKSTVRIAVFTIVAIHAVFFTGLLMQGCKRDNKQQAANNAAPETTNTTNELPSLGGATSDYYASSNDLPPAVTSGSVSTNSVPAVPAYATSSNDVAQQNFGYNPSAQQSQSAYQLPGPASNLTTSSSMEPRGETKEYTIARGDTLGKIAKAHRISISELTKVNPDLNPKALRPGQKIQIPAGAPSSASTSGQGTGSSGAEAADSGSAYVVKGGDTLVKIAQRHGTTVKAIKSANALKTDRLLVGQKLKIPAGTTKASTNGATNTGGTNSTNL